LQEFQSTNSGTNCYREKKVPTKEELSGEVAYLGRLEVLKWLRASAAAGGHLGILKWLRSQDCPWDENTCARAAEGGHLEVTQVIFIENTFLF